MNHKLKLLLISSLLTCSFSLCCYLKGLIILPEGPGLAIAEASKSLWKSGSLTPNYYTETYSEALEYSKNAEGEVWQDVFALSVDGRLLPKHSWFSVFAAVPFVALFGNCGFWIFQQVLILALVFSTYSIVERISGKSLPWISVTSCFLLTQTLLYSYQFNLDLHGTALLLAGLALSFAYPLTGGFCMGLTLFVKPSFALLVAPLTFSKLFVQQRTGWGRVLVGAAAAFLTFMLINQIFWGGPFITAYQRLPSFVGGKMRFFSHAIFDLDIIFSDFDSKIFGPAGLLPYSLCVFAMPLVLCRLWRRKHNALEILTLLSAFFYTIYIFAYPMWQASLYGNRFLLPAIYLYLISVIISLERIESVRQSRIIPNDRTNGAQCFKQN